MRGIFSKRGRLYAVKRTKKDAINDALFEDDYVRKILHVVVGPKFFIKC